MRTRREALMDRSRQALRPIGHVRGVGPLRSGGNRLCVSTQRVRYVARLDGDPLQRSAAVSFMIHFFVFYGIQYTHPTSLLVQQSFPPRRVCENLDEYGERTVPET